MTSRSTETTTEGPAPRHPTRDRFTSRPLAMARFVAQRMLLKPLVWSLTRVTVIGRQPLSAVKGGFVIVANHASHLDTPLIMGALPRRLSRYLAAGAAADYFFDVWWRRGLTALFFNAFPVDRTGLSPRKVSAKSLLQRGVPLLVFPEGTRSKDGELGPFRPGAAALATVCHVPCVPVALIGVHIAHPRGTNWPIAGRPPVGVAFGTPMVANKGESAADFTERLRLEILRLREKYAETSSVGAPSSGGSQS